MPLFCTHQDIAPADLVVADSGDIDRRAVAWTNLGAFGVKALQPPNANGLARGKYFEFIVDSEPSPGEGAGDNGSRSLRRKRTVDPQTRCSTIDCVWRCRQKLIECCFEFVDSRAVK